MRAMKLSKSEKYKGDMDIKMDNGDGINVTIGINVKNPNMSR
jgi:hypothetical protein